MDLCSIIKSSCENFKLFRPYIILKNQLKNYQQQRTKVSTNKNSFQTETSNNRLTENDLSCKNLAKHGFDARQMKRARKLKADLFDLKTRNPAKPTRNLQDRIRLYEKNLTQQQQKQRETHRRVKTENRKKLLKIACLKNSALTQQSSELMLMKCEINFKRELKREQKYLRKIR